MRNLKAYRRLRRLKAKNAPWELWLLLALLVTVLGIAVRGPSQPFSATPSIAAVNGAASSNGHLQQDPYDILPDSPELEHRNRLETGL